MQVVLSVVGTSLEAADSSTKENPVWGLLSQTLDSFLFPTLKPHQVCPLFILGVTSFWRILQSCGSRSRDGILGHQFSTVPSTGGFLRKPFSSLVLKILTKKNPRKRKLDL
jgi:hypothetical protein